MRVSITLFLSFLFILLASIGVYAQQDEPQGDTIPGPVSPPPRDIRPNMLQGLGLSREQIAALRRMNAERRPKVDAARIKLQEASRKLDLLIYSDSFSQEDFDARLREVQEAQKEVTKLRFEAELLIRSVLSAEQLAKFRIMRERFEQSRPRPAEQGRPMPGFNDSGPIRREGPGRPLPRPNM